MSWTCGVGQILILDLFICGGSSLSGVWLGEGGSGRRGREGGGGGVRGRETEIKSRRMKGREEKMRHSHNILYSHIMYILYLGGLIWSLRDLEPGRIHLLIGQKTMCERERARARERKRENVETNNCTASYRLL